MSEPFLSEIRIMAFGFAPQGWAQCNGQLLPINQQQALYSLLGTNFGGNGQTNFALPNFRDRIPIHMGDHTLAESAGQSAHTLTQSELPSHTHFVSGTNTIADAPGPGPGNVLAATDNTTVGPVYVPFSAPLALDASTVTSTGGSQPHTNEQPYLVLNFCIALQGLFPTLN
jgi:microcystin-dependent protein